VCRGSFKASLVFNKRNNFEVSMNLSVSVDLREVYSYLQYHWCPMDLIVMVGCFVSSIRYRVFRDGRAIKISIKEGRMVQIVSISCPSIMNLLNLLDFRIEIIRYKVRMVINVRIIMA